MNKCIFCDIINNNKQQFIYENEYCIAMLDEFPVSLGHALIIPKSHIKNYFDVPKEIKTKLWEVVDIVKEYLQSKYNCDGFNIGINNGEAAGQTIPHVHIHLIPRYFGDIDNPRGGVRGVIPSKQNY